MRRFYFEIAIGTSSDRNADRQKREAFLNKAVPAVVVFGFIFSIILMKVLGM